MSSTERENGQHTGVNVNKGYIRYIDQFQRVSM
jgi:hypothetical protein